MSERDSEGQDYHQRNNSLQIQNSNAKTLRQNSAAAIPWLPGLQCPVPRPSNIMPSFFPFVKLSELKFSFPIQIFLEKMVICVGLW